MEDEEPWLDDGMGYGNYLKFPDSSQQERDPWCDWDHPDLMLNWGEPRLWGLGVYIRKRMDVSSMPVSWNLTCKQLHSFTAFMTFMFWVWGELYHSPAHVWNQSCILILIGNWKRSAIPPQSWSWWFILRSGEALFPVSGSLIPGDWTLIKFLMKLSAVEVKKKQKEKRGSTSVWSCRSKSRRRQYIHILWWHHGLSICVPLEFIYWNSNSRCNGKSRWGLWEVTRSWGCRPHSWDQWETPESSLSLFALWRYNEKMAVCNLEEDFLYPFDFSISLLFKPPGL